MAQIISYPQVTPVSADLVLGTQKSSTSVPQNRTVQFTVSDLSSLAGTLGLGYTTYVAELSNFGGGAVAPTATIMSNGVGNIVWTRNSVGVYTGTLLNAFTTGKSWASSQSQIVSNPAIGANGVNGVLDTNEWPGQQIVTFPTVNTVQINHFVLAQSGAATKSDNMKIFLELRVYT